MARTIWYLEGETLAEKLAKQIGRLQSRRLQVRSLERRRPDIDVLRQAKAE